MHFQHSPETMALFRDGLDVPLVTQRAPRDARPFVHPILAPDGVGELTEDQPGHHPWQHGLYVGLNDVNGVGFWTEGRTGQPERDGTFHPEPLAPPTIAGDTADWEVRTQWRAPDSAPLLTETQRWHLADHGETLTLDVAWTLHAATDLAFGRSDYGGLFLRMPWRPETGGDVRNSEGGDAVATTEGRRARWVALSMPIPGRPAGPAGIAFLDHPANPEHPTPWRVDGNLGIAPSRCIAGAWHLPAGTQTTSRYRLLAFIGPIDHAAIEAAWNRYAQE